MVWNTEIHSEFKGVVIALTSNFSIVFLNYLIQRIQTETMHFAVGFGGFGEIPLNLDSLLNRIGYFDKDKTAVANTAEMYFLCVFIGYICTGFNGIIKRIAENNAQVNWLD